MYVSSIWVIVLWVIGVIGLLILLSMWLMPIYNVWAARKEGQANLELAKANEAIQIAEAQNRLQAAELNKRAEVIDAEAVSLSIQKIGEALQKNPSYNAWQWVRMMEDRNGDTVYVPTEANMPILEASRMAPKTARS